jgi:hypothetical protein
MPIQRPHPLLLVAAGGFVGGTFDIVYACTYWALKANAPPQRILQSVAAGLLGKASFEGGWPTAALGLGLHYFIATSMSLVYYLVARRWPLLWQRPVLCGASYGVLLFVIMTYVVVPLSRAASGASPPTLWVVLSVAVHSLLIGLPIALFARGAVLGSVSLGK